MPSDDSHSVQLGQPAKEPSAEEKPEVSKTIVHRLTVRVREIFRDLRLTSGACTIRGKQN